MSTASNSWESTLGRTTSGREVFNPSSLEIAFLSEKMANVVLVCKRRKGAQGGSVVL